jgi:hypothetical protein
MKYTTNPLLSNLCYLLLVSSLSFFYAQTLQAQGATCATSTPVCLSAPVTFPANTTGTQPTGPNYGCLLSAPRQSWFYFEASVSGAVNFSITNSASLDIDYIMYGPFASVNAATSACGAIGSGGANGTVQSCSYASGASESGTINVVAGQFYVFLITNFSGTATNITFSQTSGAGSTECDVCFRPLTATVGSCTCVGGQRQVVVSNIQGGVPQEVATALYNYEVMGGTIVSSTATNPGSVTIQLAAGEVSWALQVDDGNGNFCRETFSGSCGALVEPEFVGLNGTICQDHSSFTIQAVNTPTPFVGTITASSNPGGIFSIASNTVTVTPSNLPANSGGVFTLTYTIPANTTTQTGCAAYSITHQIEIQNYYDPTFTVPAVVCQGAAAITLTAAGSPTATQSLWAGPFVTDLGVNGSFNPSTVGTYTIDHTVNATGGAECRNTYSQTITVVPQVNATLQNRSYCASQVSTPIDLQTLFTATTTAGGTWSGPNVLGGQFLWDGSSGSFNFTYTVGNATAGGSCLATGSATLTINASPTPAFTPPSPVCVGSAAVNLSNFLTSNPLVVTTRTWALSGVGTIDATTGIYTPPATGTGGIATITLSETIGAGATACTRTHTQVIDIQAGGNPAWNFTPDAFMCVGEAAISLNPLITGSTGGTFTGPGVSGAVGAQTFNPATAGVGTHVITYTVGTGVCQATLARSITVSPTATTTLSNRTVCADPSRQYDLQGLFAGATTTAGGVFSLIGGTGTGTVTGNQLNYNAVSGSATFNIQYQITSTAGGTCSATSSATLTIEEAPNPSFDMPDVLCTGAAAIDLNSLITSSTVGIPTRTFSLVSGPGSLAGTTYTPPAVGGATGYATIRLTETIGSCTLTWNEIVQIVSGGDATWTNPGIQCFNATYPLDLNAFVTGDLGGTWSGTGVTAVGMFTPTAAGDYAITYTVGTLPCQTSVTNVIHVAPDVNPELLEGEYQCEFFENSNAAEYDLTGLFLLNGSDLSTLTTPNGYFTFSSGDNFTNLGTGNTPGIYGDILFVNPPGGTYIVQYHVGEGACAEMSEVTLNVGFVPTPDFDLPDVICATNGDLDLSSYITSETNYYGPFGPPTRTWSIVSGSGATLAGTTLTPTASGGTLTIRLTERENVINFCDNIHDEVIQILPDADATWTNPSPLCISDAPFDLTAYITGTTGGTWSGTDVTVAGSFAPTSAGTYTITYTVGSGICQETMTHSVVVEPAVTAVLNPAVICYDGSQEFELTQLFDATNTKGGMFILDAGGSPFAGSTVTGEVLHYTGPGVYNITYTLMGASGGACTASASTTVTVVEQPNASLDLPSSFCAGQTYDLTDYLTSPTYIGTVTRTYDIVSGAATVNSDGTGFTSAAVGTLITVALTEEFTSGTLTCSDTWTEVIAINDCTCGGIEDLIPSVSTICEGTTFDITAITGINLDGVSLSFGYASSTTANPYTGGVTSLGTATVADLSGTGAGPFEATFAAASLPAVSGCTPVNHTIYAYLTVAGTCNPMAVATVTVYPNPADIVLTPTTNNCITVITPNCPNFTVYPSTIVQNAGAIATTQTVTISGASGSPCAVATQSVNIPACDPACPDFYDLSAAANSLCGSSNTTDIVLNTEEGFNGRAIHFGYTTSPTLQNPYSAAPISLGTATVAAASGVFTATLAAATLPAPAATSCDPITYTVYAYLDDVSGLTSNCRPYTTVPVTVYPSLSGVTLTVNTANCISVITPSCPDVVVTPSAIVQTPGLPATTVSVAISGGVSSPCTAQTQTVNIPACDPGCPEVHDLQAAMVNLCAASNTTDLTVITSSGLNGAVMNFGYTLAPAVNNPYVAAPTLLGTATVANSSGAFVATLAAATLPAPTGCNPQTYIIYAYPADVSGFTATCRPYALSQVTVYPDPTARPITVTYSDCRAYFSTDCSTMFVTPSSVDVAINNGANVAVSIGISGSPSCAATPTASPIAVNDAVTATAGACTCNGGNTARTVQITAADGSGTYTYSATGGSIDNTGLLTLNAGVSAWTASVLDNITGCITTLSGACEPLITPIIVGNLGPFCADDAIVSLQLSPSPTADGTFSGAGITDGANNTATFDPSTAGAGLHTLTYTAATGEEQLNCAYTSSVQVLVNPNFSPLFDMPTAICASNGGAANTVTLSLTTAVVVPAYLTGVTAAEIVQWQPNTGVVENADGVTAIFTPPVVAGEAVPGIYTVCVNVGVPSCIQTHCETIEVLPAAESNINNTTLCVDGFPETIDLSVMFNNTALNPTTPGGCFTMTAATGASIQGCGQLIVTQAGTYSITYTVNTAGADEDCDAVGTATITIENTNAAWDGPSTICRNIGTAQYPDLDTYLTPSTTTGGTWSYQVNGAGGFVTTNIDGSNILNPTTFAAGTVLTIRYTLAASGNCPVKFFDEIVVIEQCNETCNADLIGFGSTICQNNPNLTIYISNYIDADNALAAPFGVSLAPTLPTTGTVATGFTDNGDGTLSIDPSLTAAGTYLISYEIDDDDSSCDAYIVYRSMVIYPTFVPNFDIPAVICADETDVPLALTGTTATDIATYATSVGLTADDLIDWYVVSGNGVTDNGTDGVFNPNTAGAGTYSVCVDVGIPSCLTSYCETIVVSPQINADMVSVDECIVYNPSTGSGSYDLSQFFADTNTTPGGIFTFTGGGANTGTGLGNIYGNNLIVSTGGSFNITYTVGNATLSGTSCYAQTDFSTVISFIPQPLLDIPSHFCLSDPDGDMDDYYTGIYSAMISGQSQQPVTRTWEAVPPTGIITLAADGTYQIVGTGTVVISLTESVDDGGTGACEVTITEIVTVYDATDPTWTPQSPLCMGGGIIILGAVATAPAVSTWTGSGVSISGTNWIFDPAVAGIGIHTISHITGTGTCQAADIHDIRVIGSAVATINDLTLCISPSGSVNLTSLFDATTTAGGTFACVSCGTATVSGSSLNYSQAGNYTVSYTIGDASGVANDDATCTDTDEATITIVAGPGFTVDLPDNICVGAGGVVTDFNTFVLGGTAANGTWTYISGPSGFNAATGEYTTAIGQSGYLTVQYCETVAGVSNPCTACMQQTILVSEGGNPEFTLPSSICLESVSSLVLETDGTDGNGDGAGSVLTINGTFSGSSITPLTANAGIYTFAPTSAGVYTITYTVGSGTCAQSLSKQITVYEQATASLSNQTICYDEDELFDLESLLPNGAQGGSFSLTGGSGVGTISGNHLAYTTPGIYNISYTLTSGGDAACAATDNAIVTIVESPIASFDAPSTVCNGSVTDLALLLTSQTMSGAATAPTTRTWSSSNTAVATIDNTTGILTALSVGTTTITLTETYTVNGVNCVSVSQEQIQVINTGIAAWVAPQLCESSGVYTLEAAPIAASSVWSGVGVSLVGGAWVFDPATSGDGVFAITHTVGSGTCQSHDTHNITVLPDRTTNLQDITVCQSPSGTINLSAMLNGATTGGTYTVTADNLALTPTINNGILSYQISFSDVQPYQITIQYSLPATGTGFGCDPAPSTAVITISGTTETAFDLPNKWCVQDGDIDLSQYVAISGGTFALTTSPETALVGNIYTPNNGDGIIGITYTPPATSCGLPHTEYIEIIDNSSIVITAVGPFCPNATAVNLTATVTTPAGTGTAVVNPIGGMWSGTGITDNVNGTFNPALAGVGTHTITYTYTNCSNCCIFTQTIDIVVGDATAPVLICPPTVTKSALGCYAIVNVPVATATDNCGNPITISYVATDVLGEVVMANTNNNNASGMYPVGTNTITWTATDANGNTATCSSIVQVNDMQPPAIFCPAPIVQANDAGVCQAFVAVTAPFAMDNCGIQSVTNSITNTSSASGIYSVGTTNVVWTITDLSGNTATCSTAVIVQDLEKPIITCPTNLTLTTTSGVCTAVATWATPVPTDNCTASGSIVLTSSHTSGSSFALGVTTVTYTATDAAGNSSTCSFTVTVTDATAPVFTAGCDAVFTGNTVNGVCYGDIAVTPPTVTDGCGVHSLTNSYTGASLASGFYPVGTTTVVWTATDEAGNTATCSQTVTVTDIQAPTINCPASIVANNDLGLCSATVTIPAPYTADNCGVASVSNSFNNTADASGVYPVGVTTVVWTVTDTHGNSTTCSMTVTVMDSEAPALACPTNLTLTTTSGVCTAVATWATPVPTDNCTASGSIVLTSSHTSGSTFALGTTTVTYTATDAAGNSSTCSFTVTVTDATAPVFTAGCDAVFTGNTVNGVCYGDIAVTPPTVTDGCGVHSLTNSYTGASSASGFYPVGTTTITWTATDEAGNTATCNQTVTVTDIQAPTINCPASVMKNNDLGLCSATVTIPAPYTADNCGVASVSNNFNNTADASGVYPVGVTTVIWTVTDIHNNTATCSMTVTVMDSEAPALACPANINLTTDLGVCTAVATWATPVPTDNCTASGSIVLTSSHTSGSTFALGTTTVTYTATDAAGNNSTCSFTVTVTDATAPVFTAGCGDVFTGNTVNGVCYGDIAVTPPTVTDGCGVHSLTNSYNGSSLASGFYPVGTTTVVWTATDEAGNTATCSQTVTVTDIQAPTINCPASIVANNDLGLCSATVTIPAPYTADNCGVASVSNSFNNTADASGVYPVGVTTVVWTVTDIHNNTATCSMTVTVMDSEAPALACPTNLTLTTTSGVCTAVATWATPVPTDNCTASGSIVLASSHTSGSSFALGVTTVTYTAIDAAGNSSTCLFTVTVTDATAPVFTAGCDAVFTGNTVNGVCYGDIAVTPPTVTDGCGVHSLTNSYTGASLASGFYPVGTTTVVWTATDEAGNTATCSQTVTVTDVQAPTINCPASVMKNNDLGLCSATVTIPAPYTADNCGVASVSNNFNNTADASGVYPVGVTTVVWTVTDIHNNTATCSMTVTVMDSEAPALACPTNINLTTDLGACTAVATWATPVPTDNCTASGSIVLTSSHTSGSTFALGVTTVTYTATDAAGNSSTCSFTVTVTDATAPVFTAGCGDVFTGNTVNGVCYGDIAVTPPTVTDGCGVHSLTNSYTGASLASGFYPVGTTTVVWTATDEAGNTATCSQTVTVTDIQAPTINCPASIVANNDLGLCSAAVTIPAPYTADNCGVASVSNSFNNTADASGVYPVGVTTVVWTVTDIHNNTATCSMTVTVMDSEAPALACPTNLTLTTTSGVCTAVATWATPVPTDNCTASGSIVLASSHTSGSTFALGTTTVTYTATDAAGNSSTCSFIVTVTDATAPVFTAGCDAVFTGNTVNGVCYGDIAVTPPTVTDGCGVHSLTNSYNGSSLASGFYPVGTTTVVWTATDEAGNTATCSQTVTVTDIQAPTINCPASIVANNDLGLCSATVTIPAPYTADNCGVASVSNSFNNTADASGVYPVGVTTVVWTVTDIHNNTATCSMTVTVMDSEAPALACPTNLTLTTTSGVCTAVATWATPVPTDNCTASGSIVLASSHTSGSSFALGVTTVTYTATDAAGNSSTCSFTVTVTDATAPVFTAGCDAVFTGNTVNGVCYGDIAVTPPTVTDGCGVHSLTNSYTGASLASGFYPVGTTTVVWTATDEAGNTATCSQTVTVTDIQAPTINCPASIVANNDLGLCSAAVTISAPYTADNCGVASVSNNFNNTADASGVYPVGVTTVVWTVTDIHNNTATCSMTVTVMDSEAPALACPTNLTLTTTSGVCTAVATWATPVPTDNCTASGSIVLTSSHTSGSTFALGTTTVTYTATDAAGNSSTCSFTVTVTDATAPVFTAGCGDVFTGNTVNGVCYGDIAVTPPTVTDGCGVHSLTNSYTGASLASGFYPVGTTTVVWTATDEAGNTATCSQTVTVTDIQAPTINCPASVMKNNDLGLCSATVTIPAPYTADNCGVASVSNSFNNTADASGVYPVGVTTVVWTVTDTHGNSTTCSMTVTVMDSEAPALACPTNLTLTTTSGVCTAVATWATPVPTDNCTASGSIVLTSSHTSGSTFALGVTTVTYTATDAAGNSSTCSFTVTVTDATAPVFTAGCDAVFTGNTVNGVCYGDIAVTPPTVTDGCGVHSLTNSYTGASLASGFYPVGTTTVVWTATDEAGNTATCSQTVTVTDIQAPTINCPASIVANNDLGLCSAAVTISAPYTADNCGVASVSNNFNNTADASGVYPVGVTTVVWTVTDTHGNSTTCSMTVTVMDSEAPALACPTNLTLTTTSGVCTAVATWATPVPTDNCTASGSIVLTSSHTSGSTFALGTTTVTYTATDAAGNSSTCSFTVTVTDATAPVFTAGCDAVFTGNTVNGVCYGDIAVTPPTVTDGCGVHSLTNSYTGASLASGFYPVGTTTVVWTATDEAGNTATCSQTVTVTDIQAPTINCPASIVANNDLGLCSAAVTISAPYTADNCGVASVSNNFNNTADASGAYPVGVTTVVWTVTDIHNNTATCSMTVTVMDSEAPALACPTNLTLTTTSGVCTAVATWATPVPTDNCTASGSIVLTSSHTSGSTFALGTTTVTYTATDAAGNSSTCSFIVTVTDATAPVFTAGCDAVFTGNTILGECFASLNIASPVATDDCGAVTLSNDYTNTSNASGTYPVGTTVITWTATDIGGNITTCMQTVTVTDNESPTISCQNIVQLYNTPGLCGATINIPQPTVSDNCGIQSIVNNFNNTADASGFYPVGNTTVLWTVTDVHGNIGICQTLVRVLDNEAPVVQCPAPISVITDCSLAATGADVVVPMPIITDNCSISSVTNSFNGSSDASGFYPIGTTTVTWTIRDVNFNTVVCSTTITVSPCCNAKSGFVTVTPQNCPGDNVAVTAVGYNTTPDYAHYFVVINNSTGLIVAINTTGIFETTGANALAAGAYTVYSYTVFTATPPVPTATIGGTLSAIGTTIEGCYDIANAGATFTVLESFPSLSAGTNTYEGNNGGISPFAYNIHEFTVYGGTQPYNFNWLNNGYVRYDIQYEQVDSNGDGVADIAGATVSIYYADNATWAVTVTDNNNCTTGELTFSNVPVSVNTILDIDSYVITPQSLSVYNGAITIVPSGGDPSCASADGYSYQWAGPDTWTGAATSTEATITNLPYGWYSVTVTDCAGQETQGWYWVPRERRGRTKAESALATMAITAMPNPFSSVTHIELSLSETREQVRVAVFSLDGKMVSELFNGKLEADAVQQIPFDASNLTAGMYAVVAITEQGEREQIRVILTK